MSKTNGSSVVTWKLLFLLGLRGGYSKYCCFLCEWDSWAWESRYTKKVWPKQKSLMPGRANVQHPPLVESQKIFLQPLHIKLQLMKNFVRALNKTGAGFKYLFEKFPRLSEEKITEGVFMGPQICELLRDDTIDHLLHGKEKKAWKAF